MLATKRNRAESPWASMNTNSARSSAVATFGSTSSSSGRLLPPLLASMQPRPVQPSHVRYAPWQTAAGQPENDTNHDEDHAKAVVSSSSGAPVGIEEHPNEAALPRHFALPLSSSTTLTSLAARVAEGSSSSAALPPDQAPSSSNTSGNKKPPRKHVSSSRPWTTAECDLLLDLTAQGCRLAQVAAGLARTVEDCRHQLDALERDDEHRHGARDAATTSMTLSTSPPPSVIAPESATTGWFGRPSPYVASASAASASPAAGLSAATTSADTVSCRHGDDNKAPPSSAATSTSAVTAAARSTTTKTSSRAAASAWTLEEDLRLADAVAAHGPSWTSIADRYFPAQRGKASLKSRWSLIESLMITSNHAAATGGGTTSLEDVLRRYHATSTNHVQAQQRRDAQQRAACAFLSATTATPSPASSVAVPPSAASGRSPSGAFPSSVASSMSVAGVSPGTSPAVRGGGGGALVGTKRSAPLTSSPPPSTMAAPLGHVPAMLSPPSSSAASYAPTTLEAGVAALAAGRDVTGDQLVDMVKNFVERHAVDVEAAGSAASATTGAPAAPVVSSRRQRTDLQNRETQHRAAAASSVHEVLAHLEIHRPQEQIDRVAQEVSHQYMAVPPHGGAMSNASPSSAAAHAVPLYVTSMDCDASDVAAATAGQQHFDPSPQQQQQHMSQYSQHSFDNVPDLLDGIGARHSLRAPTSDEVQAIVAMHIHRAVEEGAASVQSMPSFRHPAMAAHPPHGSWLGASAGSPAASEEEERSHAATIARASSAAFLASWANIELAGSLSNTAWSNVFEPPRCAMRSAVPRALAFLPCAYLTLAAPSSSSNAGPHTTSSGGGGGVSLSQYLCPKTVIDKARSFASDLRAALPSLPSAPWSPTILNNDEANACRRSFDDC